MYVRMPVPESNMKEVRNIFDGAMSGHLGISFSTVCATDNVTCCRAWVPVDEGERQRAMCPRDLKLSAAVGNCRRRGKPVRSRFLWWYLRFRYRRQQAGRDDVFWG